MSGILVKGDDRRLPQLGPVEIRQGLGQAPSQLGCLVFLAHRFSVGLSRPVAQGLLPMAKHDQELFDAGCGRRGRRLPQQLRNRPLVTLAAAMAQDVAELQTGDRTDLEVAPRAADP